MLIPVPEDLSASALALCEPWACVEDSYVEEAKGRRSRTAAECSSSARRKSMKTAFDICQANPDRQPL